MASYVDLSLPKVPFSIVLNRCFDATACNLYKHLYIILSACSVPRMAIVYTCPNVDSCEPVEIMLSINK